MRRTYGQNAKTEAIRRVIEEGQPVDKVSREMQIERGSLFFWIRRAKQSAKQKFRATHEWIVPS